MSTLEGTTMHPRCRHIGACWDLLEWFHLFGTSKNISQNSISNLKRKHVKQNTSRNSISNLKKKNQIFMLPCCSTREDLSIDVSITNVGLILTKLGWFIFSGYGQMDGQTDGRTDRQTDGQTRFWNPHMEACRHTKISTQSSKLVVSCRSLYASPEDGDAKILYRGRYI